MQNYKTAILKQAAATYPQLARVSNQPLENRINRLIKRTVDKTLPTGRYQDMNIITAASKYETTVNYNDILSLRFENYYYPEMMASGITVVQALTVNLITGKKYKLRDLFREGSNYKAYLDNIIEQEIIERGIPLINEFPGITGDEVFYLKKDTLVIVYQEYELTPGYYGTLEFNIPYSKLEPLINENSPIARLM
ncbi:DUF3298 domain-containing protein [Iocasia frigidifontis]|uniref:DUF3298 domain-containing protein n=1 Tax=Iocasia fonsfrigidae TaxID=2682810 RepID=A0A8A7K5Q2_9FIRM|nr:RsiV family protein [Iocasia fonsfrigidae]QTL97103.1 DUF3298 domain-containing protein [Iocasia fonsfrigidae]